MTYPEGFAVAYERWAADMTEDVPFYVELAKEADGPVRAPPSADVARSAVRVRACFQVAASGGPVAWNAFASDHAIASSLEGQRQEEPFPHTLRYAAGDGRVDIVLDSGETSSLWWATRNEWLGLIDVAGLELEALYGWFDRRPIDDESREFVFVTRKPA